MRLIDAIYENRLLSRWADLLPRPASAIGSIHEADAEFVPLDEARWLAVKVDTVAEEIAAGLYTDPATAGRIAAISVLSDLAAVGAEPIGLLLSVVLPRGDVEAVQSRVAVGVRAACEAAQTGILGGDTSVGPALAITVAGFGLVPAGQALRRVGLRAGHTVFVAGGVGLGAALAAARLLDLPGFTEEDYAPPVRITVGRALRGVASAAMDTSDGLVATLDQLARLNGVGIRVETTCSSLLHPKAEAVRAAARLPAFAFVASCHGEFELVFAVPPDRLDRLDGVRAALGAEPLRIGIAYAGEGLCIGDTPIDGARIRNLLDDVGGDPLAYVTALISISPPGLE
jgi:thiamine-monophosphate kinase